MSFAFLKRLPSKHHDTVFLGIITFIFALLRFPSLFEPYWYGDEAIYEVLGKAINTGRLLYVGIWDNKPPLLYLFYAFVQSDQFSIRLLSLLFGLASVCLFFFVAKMLFSPQYIGKKTVSHTMLTLCAYCSTAIFAVLFALPIFEGNIANAENFIALPIIFGAYLTLLYIQRENKTILLAIGFVLSLAFLIKVVAIFDMAAFSLFLLISQTSSLRKITASFSLFFSLGIAFSVPIILTILFFIAKGAGGYFIDATLQQNVGYVGYGNAFIISQGLLIIKTILLVTVVIALYFSRKKISLTYLFLLS